MLTTTGTDTLLTFIGGNSHGGGKSADRQRALITCQKIRINAALVGHVVVHQQAGGFLLQMGSVVDVVFILII